MSGFTIIDEATTERLLTMRDGIEIVRRVFEDVGRNGIGVSEPAALFLTADAAGPTHFKVKGGHVPSFDVCGFRIAGDVGEEIERHNCYLLDPVTAEPLGLVAQTHLHRLRTAASGLFTARILCDRPDPVVVLIGAGRIGTCLAEGFRQVFATGTLRLVARRPERARALVERLNDPAIHAYETAEAAAEGADLVIALSAAREPVIAPDLFAPGTTIIGMGEHHELPHGLLALADRFFVDEFGFATVLGSLSHWIRSGLVTREDAQARLTATIGEVVTGGAVGRRDGKERILAIVQGLAVADIAFAEACRRRVVGTDNR